MKPVLLQLLFLCVLIVFASHVGCSNEGNNPPICRHPDPVIPLKYSVQLKLDLSKLEFQQQRSTSIPGTVAIYCQVVHRTSQVSLNSRNLNIRSVAVRSGGGDAHQHQNASFSSSPHIASSSEWKVDNRLNLLSVQFGRELDVGEELELLVEYTAPLRKATKKKHYAGIFAVFQPTTLKHIVGTKGARSGSRPIFPCFSNSHFRTPMTLSMLRREGETTLFNSEIATSRPDSEHPGFVRDDFSPTEPLAPYQFGFVVGELDLLETSFGGGHNNKSLKMYWPRGENRTGRVFTEDREEMADSTGKMMSILDSYFGDENRSRRVDKVNIFATTTFRRSVAVPGLVTLRERKPSRLTTAKEAQFEFTSKMATLLPYLWLGGTSKSHNMYLNQGISRLAFYHLLESFLGYEPWQVNFVILEDAAEVEYKRKRAWLSNKNCSEEEFPRTLEKETATLLLRMTSALLTPKSFQKGLRNYIANSSNEENSHSQFFSALQNSAEEAGDKTEIISVAKFLKSWSEAGEPPMIRAEWEQKSNRVQAKLHDHPSGENWLVPVRVFHPRGQGTGEIHWLKNSSSTVSIPLRDHDHSQLLFLLDNEVSGASRVIYDETLLSLIETQLEKDHTLIPPLNRAKLLSDYVSFAERGLVKIPVMLNLTRYLAKEADPSVWNAFLSDFEELHEELLASSEIPNYKKDFRSKLDSALTATGVANSIAHLNYLGENSLFEWACTVGAPSCKFYAHQLLYKIKYKARHLWFSPDTTKYAQNELLCALVRHGGEEAFSRVLATTRRKLSEDSRRSYYPLTCAPGEFLKEKRAQLQSTLDAGALLPTSSSASSDPSSAIIPNNIFQQALANFSQIFFNIPKIEIK